MARKKKTEEAANAKVLSKEESFRENMEKLTEEAAPVDAELKAHMDKMDEKVYSYEYFDEKGRVKKRVFKYKDRTERDILQFAKGISDQWDAAPIDSKVHFMFLAFPKFIEYLKKTDPELYLGFMHSTQPLKEVN
jgi:hypothetical protein